MVLPEVQTGAFRVLLRSLQWISANFLLRGVRDILSSHSNPHAILMLNGSEPQGRPCLFNKDRDKDFPFIAIISLLLNEFRLNGILGPHHDDALGIVKRPADVLTPCHSRRDCPVPERLPPSGFNQPDDGANLFEIFSGVADEDVCHDRHLMQVFRNIPCRVCPGSFLYTATSLTRAPSVRTISAGAIFTIMPRLPALIMTLS